MDDIFKRLNELSKPYKSITNSPAFQTLNQINLKEQMAITKNIPIHHVNKFLNDLEVHKATTLANLQLPSTLTSIAITETLQRQNDLIHRIQELDLFRHKSLAVIQNWNNTLLDAYEIQQAHLEEPIPESFYNHLEDPETSQIIDPERKSVVTWDRLFTIISFLISLKLSFDTTAQLNEIQDQFNEVQAEQQYQTELLEEHNELLRENNNLIEQNNMLLKSQLQPSALTEEQINKIIDDIKTYTDEKNLPENNFGYSS